MGQAGSSSGFELTVAALLVTAVATVVEEETPEAAGLPRRRQPAKSDGLAPAAKAAAIAAAVGRLWKAKQPKKG